MSRFTDAATHMADSVEGFHRHFGIEVGRDGIDFHSRLTLLMKEVGEHANAINKGHPNDEVLKEMADIAYVALGTLELAGEDGVDAMLQVVDKNNSKTTTTHELNPETGKILRS